MGLGRQACLMWGVGWLWLLAGGVLGQAPAAGLTVQLRGPEGCPSADWVRGEIGRLLGRDAVALEATAATVDAEVSAAADGGFVLELHTEVQGQRGQRTLSGESCSALAGATAVIAALAIDPEAAEKAGAAGAGAAGAVADGSGGATVTTARTTHDEGEDEDAHAHEDEDEDEDGGGPRLRWQFGAGASLDVGSLPGPAFGAVLEGGFTLARLELWLSARVWPGNGLDLAGVSGEAAQVSLASGGLSGCYRALEGRVELAPCAGAQYGPMWGEGGEAISARSGGTSWFAFEIGVRGRVFVQRWLAVQALVGVVLPVLRPVFTLGGVGVVHEVAPVAGRFELGLLFRP